MLSAPIDKPSHTIRFLIFAGVAPSARITPISLVRSNTFILIVDISPSVPTNAISTAMVSNELTNTFMCAATALCNNQMGVLEPTLTFSFSSNSSNCLFLAIANYRTWQNLTLLIFLPYDLHRQGLRTWLMKHKQ